MSMQVSGGIRLLTTGQSMSMSVWVKDLDPSFKTTVTDNLSKIDCTYQKEAQCMVWREKENGASCVVVVERVSLWLDGERTDLGVR